MVDFTGNPYLTDPRFQLSDDQRRQYQLGSLGSTLTSFGAGIAQSGASGQPWMAGIAPGAAMASQSLGQQEANLAKMQQAAAQWTQMEDYRKAQQEHLAAETDKERRDQDRKDKGLAFVQSVAGSPPPGMNYQPSPVQMGPTGPQGNAIGKIEGDYSSVGPPADSKGSRGLGKYQVMDYNVGPWTKEALGQELTPQQYLANPQAQDAVFNHKFGQYRQKYGDVGAAKAWFAGEKGMNNPNAKDVNGMTVARYGQQFAANGGAPGAAPGGAGPTMASLPAFQGPGMGAPAMQPGALPPGATPQVNLPPMSGAPPGMAVGDGGPPGSPADAAPPQLAQAPAQPQLEPMPQRDPRIRALAMYPEGKALSEQMEKEYQTQLEMWKFKRSEATKTDIYRPLAPPEAKALGLPDNVQYQLNTRTNKVEPMTNTKQPRFEDIKDTNGQIIGQRNVDTNQYHPVQPVVGAGLAIDPNLKGDEVYQALTDQGGGPKANEVRGIVEGRLPLPSAQSRIPDAILTRKLAFQADPSLTDATHAQRLKTLTDLNSGKPNTAGYQLQAQGTLFNHLAEAVDKNQEINNSPYPLVNRALNAVGMAEGDPRLAALRVVLGKVNAEGEKAFEGKTTVSGLAKASEDLSATMGTPAFAGAVREYMKLVNGQQTQLIGRINRGMGYKPDDPRAMTQDNPEILTPDARASRDRVLAQTQPNKADNSKLMDAGKELFGAKPADKNASMQPKSNAEAPPKITTKADFDKLPSGALFEAPNGVIKVKP